MRNFIFIVFIFLCGGNANSWAESELEKVALDKKVEKNNQEKLKKKPTKNLADSTKKQVASKQGITQQSISKQTIKKSSVKESLIKESAIKEQAEKKATVNTANKDITFKSLAQMDEFTALGVPALALSLLERDQKIRPAFTAEWYAFEYKRINFLVALEHWQQLIDRTQWLFDTALAEKQITHKIRLWFETQQVIARLHLKQSKQALEQLQRLLWQSRVEGRDPSLPSVWRRLVIRAYLQMQNDDDARRALVKYDRDYKSESNDSEWLLLQAHVLLRTGRPQQAMPLLKKVDSDEAKALLLLAELQIATSSKVKSKREQDSINKIRQKIKQRLNGKVLEQEARWAYTFVAFEASRKLSDVTSQIQYAETLLSIKLNYPVLGKRYMVTADDLWMLYKKRGLTVANENGLLFGNQMDQKWLSLSNKMLTSAPEKLLALNAALILQNKNYLNKRQAHKSIIKVLEERKQGLALINQLYLRSKKVSNIEVLPEVFRYRMVDYALSIGEYADASVWMQSLKKPPKGKSNFEWGMRKARVLILQGDYEQSEQLIRQTFADKSTTKNNKITLEELDRYIQVVFDFQTVQQHRQAISLFELISFDKLSEKLKREIYFWKAESFSALKEYDRAALNYLSSARAVNGEGNDLWAQSARFKAAESLVQAEIFDDAEKIYSELLLITGSDSRKALIKQNLQKIRLLKTVEKTG